MRGANAVGVVVAVAVVLAGVVPAPGAGAAAPETIANTQIEPDDVVLRVDIGRDGTGTWEVVYRVRLDDENTTAAFESVRSDIERNASRFVDPFARRMESTAAAAENSTGREMAIRNVTVSADRRQLPQEYGVITYRFAWTGFARANDTAIRAGDALAGFFLDSETTLILAWPSGYEAVTVEPSPADQRDRAAVWTGPIEFATGEPVLVVRAVDGTGTGTETGTAGSPTDGSSPDGSSPGDDDGTPTPAGGGVPIVPVVAVLVALGVAAGWVYRRGGFPSGVAPGGASDGSSGTAADTAGERDDSGADAPAGDGDAAASDGVDEPPPELLSNEERVLRLLDSHGGRMKQQEVAEALDWTDAKTSQVVTRMREEGDLDSFRLGRENVLTLPDEDHP